MSDTPYQDPTGDTAARNVDNERATTDGMDPFIAADLADAYLPPPVDPTWNPHVAPRDRDGNLTTVPLDTDVGPYGLAPDEYLTNEQVARIIYQLAPLIAHTA